MLKLQIRQTLAVLSDRIKQFLRLIPSKACICDGFTVDVISTDLLVAWLDIALDHETFYHGMKLRIYLTAVKNFFGKCAKFFRDTKSELKKVVWPSKQDVKTNTIVVLVTVAIAAVVMILLDAIFGGILGLIIGA